MGQPNQYKPGILLPNAVSPRFDSLYPAGNRDAGTLIARADWTLHDVTPTSIVAGATWNIYGSGISKVDDYLRIQYPDTTSGGVSAGLALNLGNEINTLQLYTTFEARMPYGKIGPKFFKPRSGADDGNGTSNTTYGCGSGSGNLDYIGFGDGSLTSNDIANVIRLDGEYPEWIGRSYGNGAQVILREPDAVFEWDNEWHTFKIGHGFNSGTSAENETNDGFSLLFIDDELYCDATGLFNRHWGNAPRINQATWGDWVQNDIAAELHFRNIAAGIGGFV
jgi:hypothetical protein